MGVPLVPKGSVPERDVVCRACGSTFRSTKAGKAAFYCRTAECDAERKANRTVVRNRSSVETAEERAAAAARRDAERRAAAWERQRRREAARELKLRERRLKAVRRELGQLRPLQVKAVEHARKRTDDLGALLAELAELEGRAAPPAPVVPVHATAPSVAAAPAVVVNGDGEFTTTGRETRLLEEIRGPLIARRDDVGRRGVHRAVVRLANAKGTGATRSALAGVAVEALAWMRNLPREEEQT